ncbi:aldehyde dehydrogenase family protein [Streptomyces sp. NPDC003996]
MTGSGLRAALSTLVPLVIHVSKTPECRGPSAMAWAEFTMGPNHLFIGGRWVHASGDRVINVASARTGDHLGAVPDGSQPAPALEAGCALVRKPAPETVLDSVLLAEAVEEAGFPDGVINTVPGGRGTGAHLVSHPDIDKVSFTGSIRAGRQVAAACAELLRPVTLELGGNSAAVVLDDADLTANAEQFFVASLLNNGQTCYASTRIPAPTAGIGKWSSSVRRWPRAPSSVTRSTPTSRSAPSSAGSSAHASWITSRRASTKGLDSPPEEARRLASTEAGSIPPYCGDVENSSSIAQEETFGPVLTITPYDGEDEAVRLANESAYGLAGTVWTTDLVQTAQVARRVRTGTVGLNGYLPGLTSPYGGRKASELGSERGPEGLQAYQQFPSIHHP